MLLLMDSSLLFRKDERFFMKLKSTIQFEAKAKVIGKGFLAFAVLTTGINLKMYGEESKNPYLQTLEESRGVSENLNYFFNQALQEKKQELNRYGLQYNEARFQSSHYLLQFPKAASSSDESSINNNCNLNAYVSFKKGKDFNPYPFLNSNSFGFSEKVNKNYCLLQKTFSDLNFSNAEMTSVPSLEDHGQFFTEMKENLKGKDTLVVVIPGIFGEFINQVAFGEVFGQGLTKVEKTLLNQQLEQSQFQKKFENFLKAQKNQASNEIKKNLYDERLLIRNLKASQISDMKNGKNTEELRKEQYGSVSIDQWIKVSSYDDKDGNPLFKMAILGLEPMSLESIGSQERLAMIYLRRLNKFMNVYKAINNGQYPEQIVFLGYSRGTPVAYEMLTILNSGGDAGSNNFIKDRERIKQDKNRIQKESQGWSPQVVATLSLGGVSLGSSLADKSVVFREDVPKDVKVLHAVKDLILNLEIITPNDVNFLKEVHRRVVAKGNSYIGRSSIQDSKGHSETVPVITPNLDPKDKALLALVTVKLQKNYQLYAEFTKVMNEVGHEVLPPEQREALQSLQRLFSIYQDISISSVAQMNETQKLKTLDKVVTAFNDIGNLRPLLEKIVVGLPSLIPGFINAAQVARDDKYQVNTEGMKSFNDRILKNFGATDFYEKIQKIMNEKSVDMDTVVKLNDFFVGVQYFFRYAWVGGFELGTLSRMTWLAQHGQHLRKDVSYYSISGILQEPGTNYYKNGLGLSFNQSTDQNFLNQSWRDITKVGRTEDGLNGAFAGSSGNDSQVDWYKTILWPSLYKDLTNTNQTLKSKVLGIVRTHHWGLALPFAALNNTDINPNTGYALGGGNKVENVNPFPRKEFLLSMVLAIHADVNNLLSPSEMTVVRESK